jgi:prepilin-type N-terminal cleavage/methylation domain-containing protein
MSVRKIFSTTAPRNSQSGFSMIELMIVVIMITILTGIAVISFRSSKRSYAADDEAIKMLSLFREAYQRALTQRQAQRITIDRTSNLIKLTDMGRLPGGDEMLVNRAVLNPLVSMVQPSVGAGLVPPPPAPYNYTPANFGTSGTLDIYFLADGSVTNATNFANNTFAPVNFTVFFSPSPGSALSPEQAAQINSGNLMRAVTLFGATGSTKAWRFNGSQFIWEIN